MGGETDRREDRKVSAKHEDEVLKYERSDLSSMAKRRGSRRQRGFVAIPFSAALTLSTLGDDTVLAGSPITFGEDIYVMSVDATVALRGNTAGEVPIEFGYHHGDLSVAEIAEALDAELTDPDDIIARERARRPVRRAGVFALSSSNQVWNNGLQTRTKLRYSVGDGHTFGLWAANRSGGALTTGSIIEFNGTIYGRWQR